MEYTTVGELYDRCVSHFAPRVALKFRQRTCTFEELGDKARRLANAFSTLGIGKGDRVAFLMANCPEYVFSEYALVKLGAVRVPLAVLLGSDHHVYIMRRYVAVESAGRNEVVAIGARGTALPVSAGLVTAGGTPGACT